jgi:hypothetical protein
MEDQFIVAEVSKNWKIGDAATAPLLCQRFEKVINVNLKRGYKLVDWKTIGYVNGEIVNETIIAIFEKIGDQNKPPQP